MFKKILFATTASPTCDPAATVAFDLARKYNARLFVFHVFGIPSRGAGYFITDVRTGKEETIADDYIAWVKEDVRITYAERLMGVRHVAVDCTVGPPANEILRKARREDVDLIVMGAHARREDVGSYRFRHILGSTMQRVARGAHCPVLIVSRPCDACFWDLRSIVLGTDFSKASNAAFKFAWQTAKHIGSRLYLFHAVDISGLRLGQTRGYENIEQRISGARKYIEETCIPQMKGFENYAIEVREGIPHVEILKFSREKNADLIVMAHHSREVDPEQALLGSTVGHVVLRSACPVISINRLDKVQPGSKQSRPETRKKKETVQ
ncbi:MAG: universal stress protein [Desulfobacteraceae bacterium]|nr:MAG: universal stress protein [Desulfobacteraceae bacterium]